MKYSDVSKNIFAHASIPNGYYGERELVGLSLMGKTVVCIASCGCFTSPLPDVQDIPEAIWLIKNHQIYKNYFTSVTATKQTTKG